LGSFNLGGSGAGRGAGRGGPGLGEFKFPGGGAGGFTGKGSQEFGNRDKPLGTGERPTGSQLGNFLGLPSDGGLGAGKKNPVGNNQERLSRLPNEHLQGRADYARRDLRNYNYRNYYSNDWYRRYPGAWYTTRWAYGNAWAAATWTAMNSWFGYGNIQPIYYDYGNNVTYQDNSVYVNGQDAGTSQQYYQQAQTLATDGADAQTNDDEQWMPLGVFAMTHESHSKADLLLQLAVNKQGVIRGNYTASLTNDTQPVQGSVDKQTQRAAWTIGKNTENVFETGIFNLTKDQAHLLVHFGQEKTEQWLLVRVKQDEQQPEGGE
jgi:hypothetical protein